MEEQCFFQCGKFAIMKVIKPFYCIVKNLQFIRKQKVSKWAITPIRNQNLSEQKYHYYVII